MLHRFATNHEPARFLPGDLVEVRSSAEILSTLDERGALENLPFMPEMLSFSGRQFRVSRRAFKTCVDDQEMRQIENTVFLEDVRRRSALPARSKLPPQISWLSQIVTDNSFANLVKS